MTTQQEVPTCRECGNPGVYHVVEYERSKIDPRLFKIIKRPYCEKQAPEGCRLRISK
jgi:hypothetical protein